MKRSTRWILAGTAAALLGGTARAGSGAGDDAAAGDASAASATAQPAPTTAEWTEGARAQDPAHAAMTEGAPARTAADAGSGDFENHEYRSNPSAQDGPAGRGDAAELAAGNSGGRG
jgi:hypothetical protein